MPFIHLTHKKQTRANDCWYACIQMLKTHQMGIKTKPTGNALRQHRNRGPFSAVWGNKLGSDDQSFAAILQDNGLQDLSTRVGVRTLDAIQAGCTTYGPLIIGGDFGQVLRIRGTSQWLIKRQGHYVVVVGTDRQAGTIILHDPWRSHRTEMPADRFLQLVWGGTGRTIVGLA